MLGCSLVPLRIVPFEESRSRRIHFGDPDPDEKSIERWLEEMPESLIGRLLPRTMRPIRMLDPGWYSIDSPLRGPWIITSFRAGGSIV